MGKKVERFEDLVAWQKARSLGQAIYKITQEGAFARDFGLSGQMQRSAVSSMSNIAEGFERISRAEFHHFLLIAKSSCAELRSLIYVAFDIGYLDQTHFKTLFPQAEELGRIIGGLRASIKRGLNTIAKQ